jgi:endonuclease YncB( thermonuclease family)
MSGIGVSGRRLAQAERQQSALTGQSQPFGQRAKQSLSDQQFNKSVVVETEKRDRYGQEVCKIFVSVQDVNLEQTKRSMA